MIIEPSDQIQTFEFHLCKNLKQLPTFFFGLQLDLYVIKNFAKVETNIVLVIKKT